MKGGNSGPKTQHLALLKTFFHEVLAHQKKNLLIFVPFFEFGVEKNAFEVFGFYGVDIEVASLKWPYLRKYSEYRKIVLGQYFEYVSYINKQKQKKSKMLIC